MRHRLSLIGRTLYLLHAFLFSGHHLHEFVEVNGAGSIGVDFFDHNIELLIRELIVEFPQDFSQTRGGDVSISFFVVEPEGLSQLLLQRFRVLLDDELGCQRYEFVELQSAGFVSVDFIDELIENLLVEGLSHQSENIGHHVGGDAAALLPVEAVEGLAQHSNLLWGQLVGKIIINRTYHLGGGHGLNKETLNEGNKY